VIVVKVYLWLILEKNVLCLRGKNLGLEKVVVHELAFIRQSVKLISYILILQMIWGPELLLNLIYLTCEHAAWVYRVWLCINPHLIAGCHGVGPFVVVSHLDWMVLLINVFVAL